MKYLLQAVNDAAKEIKGQQAMAPDSNDIYLHTGLVVVVGRGVTGKHDFALPSRLIQYSTKHCMFEYKKEDGHEGWVCSDMSTNGTYTSEDGAKFIRIGKGESRSIKPDWHIRLSMPNKTTSQAALEYKLIALADQEEGPVPSLGSQEKRKSLDVLHDAVKKSRLSTPQGLGASNGVSSMIGIAERNKKLLEDIDQKQKELAAAKAEIKKERDERLNLQMKLKDLENKYEDAATARQAALDERTSVEKELEATKVAHAGIEKMLKDAIKSKDSLEQENQKVKAEIQDKKKEMETFQQQLAEKSRIEFEAYDRIEEQKQEIDSLNRRLDEVKEQGRLGFAVLENQLSHLQFTIKVAQENSEILGCMLQSEAFVEAKAKEIMEQIQAIGAIADLRQHGTQRQEDAHSGEQENTKDITESENEMVEWANQNVPVIRDKEVRLSMPPTLGKQTASSAPRPQSL